MLCNSFRYSELIYFRVYKKMPIQEKSTLKVNYLDLSMRKNQSNFRWLTNQKAWYVGIKIGIDLKK